MIFTRIEKNQLISFLRRYNFEYQQVTDTNFHFTVSAFEMVMSDLKSIYGFFVLKSYVDGEFIEVEELDKFIAGTKTQNILDAVELLFENIGEDGFKTQFVKELNEWLKIWEKPVRFLEGEFFRMDSEFLESEILFRSETLLKRGSFFKANEDFIDARRRLSSGDYSGCIVSANNALESLLMKITNNDSDNQGSLKKSIIRSGLIPNYFGGFLEHFEGLLQSAFTLANKSSRHGKMDFPDERNKITEPVASFCLNMVGTYIVFMVERYLESNPVIDNVSFADGEVIDDLVLPF